MRHNDYLNAGRLGRAGVALGLLPFCSQPPGFQSEVSPFPAASPLARLQAADRDGITNLLQCLVDADDSQRMLLTLLDGSRDRPLILNAWAIEVRRRALTIGEQLASRLHAQQVASALERRRDDDLEIRARSALPVA